MKTYVMVTNFDTYWDKIPKDQIGFTLSMIRFGKKEATKEVDIDSSLPVIFIKRKKNGPVEKAWHGKASNYSIKPYHHSTKGIIDRMYFNVNLESEIECPAQFIDSSEGWYLAEYLETNSKVVGSTENNLYPLFFSKFNSCGWEAFEDNTYRLLRLLGIHTIHPYDRNKQKGHPDGIFKIDNTVIIYDSTLETNYRETKKTQIDNYVSQLQKDKIDIGNVEISLKGCDKYVWIITRNDKNAAIKRVDDIHVKEITIQSLINIYQQRMDSPIIDEKELEKLLQNS